MLLNVAPKTAKGSYVTIGTRGATDETKIGGPITMSYDPETADTQTVDLLDDPPFQDSGTAGPGTLAMTLAVDPLSKEYGQLYDSFNLGEAHVFNLYVGQPKTPYNNSTARVAIAAGVATFTLGVPPWGSATEKGNIARGQCIQIGSGASADLYRIDGVSGTDMTFTQATKLAVTPLRKQDGTLSDATQAATAYRIVDTQLVYANFSARVTLTQGVTVDSGSTVVQGNVSLAPERILPPPLAVPLA